MFFLSPDSLGLQNPRVGFSCLWYQNELSVFAKPSKRTVIWEPQEKRGWYMCFVSIRLCVLRSRWMEAVGGKDMVVKSSGFVEWLPSRRRSQYQPTIMSSKLED